MPDTVPHTLQYTRRTLGSDPISRRTRYGWAVTCTCGWTRKVNDTKRMATSIGKDHLKEVA